MAGIAIKKTNKAIDFELFKCIAVASCSSSSYSAIHSQAMTRFLAEGGVHNAKYRRANYN
jgi:hypothetical protein